MKTIAIFHGINGFAGWQKDLSKKLILRGYKIIMPTFPNKDHPDRGICLKTVQSALKGINLPDLIIIGHSLGATTACDYLETIKTPISKFISVSGFGEDYNEEINSYFLREKNIDYNKVVSNSLKRIVIYGDNDPYVPQKTMENFAAEIKADDVYVVENGGHLSTGAGFTQFPLLLDLVEEN